MRRKPEKTILSIMAGLILLLFLPGNLTALMPPDKRAERNLEADYIVVGRIVGTGRVLLPEENRKKSALKGVFALKIVHIVKGYAHLKNREKIDILYTLPPETKGGITAERTGAGQVRVAENELAVVYLRQSRHQGFYEPIAQGSSVVRLE